MTTDLQKRLDDAENLLLKRKNNVDVAEKERRSRDRSKIGQKIVTLFASSFLLVLVAIVMMATTNSQNWKEVAEKLVTLLSSVLLPVVTLVIGYYFGSEQQGGNSS